MAMPLLVSNSDGTCSPILPSAAALGIMAAMWVVHSATPTSQGTHALAMSPTTISQTSVLESSVVQKVPRIKVASPAWFAQRPAFSLTHRVVPRSVLQVGDATAPPVQGYSPWFMRLACTALVLAAYVSKQLVWQPRGHAHQSYLMFAATGKRRAQKKAEPNPTDIDGKRSDQTDSGESGEHGAAADLDLAAAPVKRVAKAKPPKAKASSTKVTDLKEKLRDDELVFNNGSGARPFDANPYQPTENMMDMDEDEEISQSTVKDEAYLSKNEDVAQSLQSVEANIRETQFRLELCRSSIQAIVEQRERTFEEHQEYMTMNLLELHRAMEKLQDKELKLLGIQSQLLEEKKTLQKRMTNDVLSDYSQCRLIEALRKGEYDKETLEHDCLMYTLRDKSIPWLYQNEGEPLIVRRATQEVYKKIMHLKNNVLLTGNPGIGKTWFHNYFLLQWISAMKDDDILALGKRDQVLGIVVVKKGAPAVWMRREDALFLLMQANVTYLVDTGGKEANEAEWCNGRTILTSSPAERHYKSFLSSRHPIILYYPPWELNELLAVKPKVRDDLSDEKVEERFNFVGGIPRHVFANETNYASHCRSMYTAISQCDWSYPYSLGQGNDLEFPQRLFIHDPRDDYTSFETGFASQAVSYAAYEYLKMKDEDMLARFMDVARREKMLGVMWGQLYETSFFYDLMNLPKEKAFELTLKRLFPSREIEKSKEEVEAQNLKLNIVNVLIAKDVKSVIIELAGSPEVIAICPKDKNFAAVDGLILDRSCIYGIQVTKRQSHGLKPDGLRALEECKQILAQKFGEAEVVLIMVHPGNGEFNLTGEAWENLEKYPDFKVYEAEWLPSIRSTPRRLRGLLQP